MKKGIALLTALCSLLLSGCSWLDGSYVSIERHQQRQNEQTELISAVNYLELMDAMEALIADGAETGVIHVLDYQTGSVEAGMSIAAAYAMKNSSIGAYAVEDIHYELGSSSGLPAVAVTITYRHSLAEIQRIRTVKDVEEAQSAVAGALEGCETGIVMLVENYTSRDFAQVVQDYAAAHPETVMETPKVTEGIYGTGDNRVVELIFTYQNSRDSLRQMKDQVKPVFDAAELYVSGDGAQRQKYSQLYAFLMERFDYKLETSITPAYSLLRHGVGDSRAFATVYASMCRGAGLECLLVTGTRSGEPWTWNMVMENGHYYHVDLLRSNELGYYREFTDGEMTGYVWDYSAYPQSIAHTVSEEIKQETPDMPEESENTEASEETVQPTEVEPETLETQEQTAEENFE